MTLLLVVAHPDDETFGCGSVLARAAAAGVRSVVVCVSRGEAGLVRPGVPVPAEGLGALREAELRSAAQVLGVAEVEVHDFGDSGMEGDPPPGSICATSQEVLTALVTQAVQRHQPTLVLALSGDDGHRDHAHIRDAVLAATSGSQIPVYLHCQARSVMHAWLRERDGDARMLEYHALPAIGTPDEELTTILDAHALLPVRLEAIAAHASQRSPFEGLSGELRERFLATDRLVRVVPPWGGGPV
ncbi:MAG TPA: PIG-L deacetylase family protein, partial [Ornithinimicrobium sp.]|uniref:PIG-L deacetylase family protein n=1 Tax=Ornithinimicrobium sp. TaxID=1977084 RepID=UPI002B482C86